MKVLFILTQPIGPSRSVPSALIGSSSPRDVLYAKQEVFLYNQMTRSKQAHGAIIR